MVMCLLKDFRRCWSLFGLVGLVMFPSACSVTYATKRMGLRTCNPLNSTKAFEYNGQYYVELQCKIHEFSGNWVIGKTTGTVIVNKMLVPETDSSAQKALSIFLDPERQAMQNGWEWHVKNLMFVRRNNDTTQEALVVYQYPKYQGAVVDWPIDFQPKPIPQRIMRRATPIGPPILHPAESFWGGYNYRTKWGTVLMPLLMPFAVVADIALSPVTAGVAIYCFGLKGSHCKK